MVVVTVDGRVGPACLGRGSGPVLRAGRTVSARVVKLARVYLYERRVSKFGMAAPGSRRARQEMATGANGCNCNRNLCMAIYFPCGYTWLEIYAPYYVLYAYVAEDLRTRVHNRHGQRHGRRRRWIGPRGRELRATAVVGRNQRIQAAPDYLNICRIRV